MPVGVGFHTPLTDSLRRRDAAGDYVMRAAVGERVELSGRNIPTGRKLPLVGEVCPTARCGVAGNRTAIRSRRLSQCARSRWTASRSAARWSRTCARVYAPATRSTDRRPAGRSGTTAGKVPYCCPEPQSWTTNAPNMPDPEAEGFRSIAPGGTWSMKFRLYAK